MVTATKEPTVEAADVLWRVHQVTAVLGLGRTKIYELESSGRLPGVRIDGALRFRKSDVMRFIENLGK